MIWTHSLVPDPPVCASTARRSSPQRSSAEPHFPAPLTFSSSPHRHFQKISQPAAVTERRRSFRCSIMTSTTVANASTTSTSPFPSVVSAAWLKDNFSAVRILDASWYLPSIKPKAATLQEFTTSPRIPGAQFFDLDGIADLSQDLPHMLPSEAQFAAAADALHITNDDALVIYDRLGLFSAPRAWYTWHVFGHRKVAVLDGGLPAWIAVGGELETTPVDVSVALAPTRAAAEAAASASSSSSCSYSAKVDAQQVRSWQQVLENIELKKEIVMDARPEPRWRGEKPEPRPGLALGHIPGSGNIPWDAVQENGKFKSVVELKEIFNSSGLDVGGGGGGRSSSRQTAVFSCGSGTTACILALAAMQVDPDVKFAVYDGSWSEWGRLEGVPVRTATRENM